jgi:hypothetical protein
MRALLVAAFCFLSADISLGEDKPAAPRIDLSNPAALIGKKLDPDRAYEAGLKAPQTKIDDWSYGFDSDETLMRSGSTKEQGKGATELDMSVVYDTRCERSDKTVGLTFIKADNFKIKGGLEKGHYAEAWITFADKSLFDPTPLKVKMDFSENDGFLHFQFDPAPLSKRGQMAICPNAAPLSKASAGCSVFSLKGFSRAYDFVCNAR